VGHIISPTQKYGKDKAHEEKGVLVIVKAGI